MFYFWDFFVIFQIEYLKVCLDCDRHEINEVIEKEKKKQNKKLTYS